MDGWWIGSLNAGLLRKVIFKKDKYVYRRIGKTNSFGLLFWNFDLKPTIYFHFLYLNIQDGRATWVCIFKPAVKS